VGGPPVRDGDDRVVGAPHEEGRHLVGEVEAVERRDLLPVGPDHAAHGVQEGVARALLDKGGVAAGELGEVGARLEAELAGDLVDRLAGVHRPLARQQRQDPLGAGQGGGAQEGMDLTAEPARVDQRHPLDVLGEEVGELHRDASAQRVADDGAPVEVEHGQQVP
jgi:hypothetical protein